MDYTRLTCEQLIAHLEERDEGERGGIRSAPGSCAMDVTSCSSCRGGGAARPFRRDLPPDRPLARAARVGLTGVNHGAAGAAGRIMRRRLAKPAESFRAALGSGPASLTLPGIAPAADLLVDVRPFKEHPRTRGQRLSGRCRLKAPAHTSGGSSSLRANHF